MKNVVRMYKMPMIKIAHSGTPYVRRASHFIQEFWRGYDPPVPLVSFSTMYFCQKINPFTLVVVTDQDDKILGTVELYSMKKKSILMLMSGEKSEADLLYDDFVAHGRRASWHLYTAIICPKQDGQTEVMHAYATLACLVGSVRAIQKGYFGTGMSHNTTLYAIDVSDQGRALVDERLNFELESALSKKRQRRGNHESVWIRKFSETDANDFLEAWQKLVPGFTVDDI